jgi:acyl carrier protein
MTYEQCYEVVRDAVQRVLIARTVRPETQIYGPQADMDSLNMVEAIVGIEESLQADYGLYVNVEVGSLAGTVTVADLAQHVYEML